MTSWWTHQLHEVHQLERVLSRRQVHKVCRNTKLCHGVWLNSTLTLHTPKHQALHTVKPSGMGGYSKHQALHIVKHSQTLRNGRIQQTPSPAHKHQALHTVKSSGMAGHSKHQALHTVKHQALHTVKPSGMAGYSKHQALHTVTVKPSGMAGYSKHHALHTNT